MTEVQKLMKCTSSAIAKPTVVHSPFGCFVIIYMSIVVRYVQRSMEQGGHFCKVWIFVTCECASFDMRWELAITIKSGELRHHP